MNSIVPAHEGRAADLPEVEPDVADLIAIDVDELHGLDLTQERIDASLTELARYGALDELAERRHRRTISTALTSIAATANLREVTTA